MLKVKVARSSNAVDPLTKLKCYYYDLVQHVGCWWIYTEQISNRLTVILINLQSYEFIGVSAATDRGKDLVRFIIFTLYAQDSLFVCLFVCWVI